METNSWAIAFDELIHVGGALIIIIAVVSVLTGIMREYIPQEKLQKKLAKHERRGPLIGALLGTLTPFCSASMVPVVMGMVEMGTSMATIFAFLISAPLCNFIVVGLIMAVFGAKIALIYFILTLSGAMLAGYVVGRSPLRHAIKTNFSPATPVSCGVSAVRTPDCSAAVAGFNYPVQAVSLVAVSADPGEVLRADCTSAASVAICGAAPGVSLGVPHAERLRHALHFALALFKRIIPYVLIGAIISALSAAFLPGEMVEKYVGGDSWMAIPVAAGIGVPLYLRIEMAIPLLKVLIAKGMSMGAAMALLIGGTGASLPEIAIISSVLKPKAVIAFVLVVFSLAVTGGIIFNFIV